MNNHAEDIKEYLSGKKTVHISLPVDTHKNLRIALEQNGNVSMQQLFSEVATRIIFCDEYMLELIKSIQVETPSKSKTRVLFTDHESLYDILEKESPLSRATIGSKDGDV